MTKSKTKDMITISMFVAITAILAQIIFPLPFTPVPITLGALGFLISGAYLGTVNGCISQIIYVLIGAVGVPVFSGFSGGVSVVVGPTGGYIMGFILGALVIGVLSKKLPHTFLWYVLSMSIGMLACYTLGTIWFMFIMKSSLFESLVLCVFPYIVGDIFKIIVAAFLVNKLNKIKI